MSCLIGTPDHWHAKMLIDACRAGKDVYCEKPLTLTIDEGKTDSAGRSADGPRRAGRLVAAQRSSISTGRRTGARRAASASCSELRSCLGKNVNGGPVCTCGPVPEHFNWDLWQGQTPDVPYIPERSHYTFRWWYEYSGGQMTDWGAHHLDIAQWAIDCVADRSRRHGATFPTSPNGYNVAIDFQAQYRYANGVRDDRRATRAAMASC